MILLGQRRFRVQSCHITPPNKPPHELRSPLAAIRTAIDVALTYPNLRPWPEVKAYVDRLRRFDPPHSVGHNPLGGWMIAILLATLATMIATGLFAASRRAAGPFAHFLAPATAQLAGNIHKLASNFLIGFIVVHVAGVAVDWLLTSENLVKAMITGRKRLPPEAAALEKPVAPIWRAVLTGLLALALAAGLTLATNFSTP